MAAALALAMTSAVASASPSSDAAAAKKRYATYQTPPKKLLYTEPLASKVPAGKTFYDLNCLSASSSCAAVSDGIKQGVEALGWTYKTIAVNLANPATLISAAQTALADPNTIAVSQTGLPQAVWSSLIPQFEAKGIPFINNSAGTLTGGSKILPVSVLGTVDSQTFGKESADGIIADSKGKGHILIVNVPDLAAINDVVTGFKSQMASACAGCKVTTVNASVSQHTGGGIPALIVSALQKDPSLKYVQLIANATGVANAIASAGLKVGAGGVKLFSVFPQADTLAEVKAGKVEAAVTTSYHITGMLIVDAAARFATKTPYVGSGPKVPGPAGGGMPSEILNKKTVTVGTQSIDYPKDYLAQFKKMWLVS